MRSQPTSTSPSGPRKTSSSTRSDAWPRAGRYSNPHNCGKTQRYVHPSFPSNISLLLHPRSLQQKEILDSDGHKAIGVRPRATKAASAKRTIVLDDPAESPARKKKQKGKTAFLRQGGAYVTWSGETFRAPMPKLPGKKQLCGAFYRPDKGC